MSKTGRTLLGLVLATTSLGAIACSDAPRPLSTAPDRTTPIAAEGQNLLGGLLSLLIAPVERTSALASDVVWSFDAGPNGAVSSNSRVGLTVLVPRGAVSSNVRITVTALQGSPIAYRFSPHMEFSNKAVLTQDLRGTTAGGLGGLLNTLLLKGAHFPGDYPSYTNTGLAVVDEVVPALLSGLTQTASFGVDHFSGWIVASGRK